MSEINEESNSIEKELEKSGWIIYPNVGNSMWPLIRQGQDLMMIKKRPCREDGSPLPLKKWDVVLFKRPTGPLVLHRILNVRNNNGVTTYDICGDNQKWIERGVSDDQIIGVLNKVLRDVNTGKRSEMDPCDPEYMKNIYKRTRRVKMHNGVRRIRSYGGRVLRKLGLR